MCKAVPGLAFFLTSGFVFGAMAEAAFAFEGGNGSVIDGPPDCRG